MKFSEREIKDITISTLVMAFVFGGLENFFVALFAVGLVFLSHELLGHKLVAQHFGCSAEFRKWDFGLFLALIMSLFGGAIVAPGAVYISPITETHDKKVFAFRIATLGRREYGLIALAGPGVNIILGFVCLGFMFYGVLPALFYLTAKISFMLALFNMLPILFLDGAKILAWNKKIWLVSVLFALFGYLVL